MRSPGAAETNYPLLWRERIGFARLVTEYAYPIVPFSMIGVDDVWDVVADSDSALYAPARALAVRLDVDPDLLWPCSGAWDRRCCLGRNRSTDASRRRSTP